jgi:hypothetical protein
MSDHEQQHWDDPVESMIRQADNFVRPSDELRPRILEAGRQWQADQQAQTQLGKFVIASLLLFLLGSTFVDRSKSIWSKLESPSSEQLQQRADFLGSSREIGPQWGLSEAVHQSRSDLALRFGANPDE